MVRLKRRFQDASGCDFENSRSKVQRERNAHTPPIAANVLIEGACRPINW